jgi:3-dehydroquinate dehydratase type I
VPRPRICVVVQAYTTDHAVNKVRSMEALSPDLIEIRLDYARNRIDPCEIRRATEAPLIATNRVMEQRECQIDYGKDWMAVILEACEAGFQYADVEITAPNLKELADEISDRGSDLIVSHHDYQGTPSEKLMEETLSLSLAKGGKICKIVGTANAYKDNLTYFDSVKRNPGTISFGMGHFGIPSRILSALFGGAFTYASAVKGEESASGQLTLEEMREIYRLIGVGE